MRADRSGRGVELKRDEIGCEARRGEGDERTKRVGSDKGVQALRALFGEVGGRIHGAATRREAGEVGKAKPQGVTPT